MILQDVSFTRYSVFNIPCLPDPSAPNKIERTTEIYLYPQSRCSVENSSFFVTRKPSSQKRVCLFGVVLAN